MHCLELIFILFAISGMRGWTENQQMHNISILYYTPTDYHVYINTDANYEEQTAFWDTIEYDNTRLENIRTDQESESKILQVITKRSNKKL